MRLALLAVLCLIEVGNSLCVAQEGAYVDPMSVAKGDIISMYISTSITPFDLKIYSIGNGKSLITTFTGISGGVQPVPDSSYWYGCNWPITLKFVIPASWKSGIYSAEFPTISGTGVALFIVKENSPGALSPLVVSLSTNTWQAYNNFGGKSLYENNSSSGQRSYKVSFSRPFQDKVGTRQYFRWEKELVSWLAKENIAAEFTNSVELDRSSDLLNHYKVLMIVGHDEYWSRNERNHLQDFVNNGGNLIILGGNTCWWQVRYEDEGRRMICYKNASFDPFYHIKDSLVTVNWSSAPVNFPENSLTGTSFRNGGFVAYDSILPRSQGFGDYAVLNSQHWIYNNTGLIDGTLFGFDDSIVGYEVDGAMFQWQGGFPLTIGSDGSPPNYKILGISPSANINGTLRGHATMGIYKKAGGGWVFNVATTNWCDGLASDTVVQAITRNSIEKFSTGRFPPDIVSWSPSIVDVDSIHHESVYLHRRQSLVVPGDSLKMTVNASDPSGEPLRYFWLNNNSIVSVDSEYTYYQNAQPSAQLRTVVTAKVVNSRDTASVGWEIFAAPLKIVSKPPVTQLAGSTYFYKLDVINFFGDSLRYSILRAPSWLTIDEHGIIAVDVPADTGSFEVEIMVTNRHNESDAQIFTLHVLDGIAYGILHGQFPPFRLYHNYPNPCNPRTTITYSLNAPCIVRMELYNELGQVVTILIPNEFRDVGKYTIVWNGEDNMGRSVNSGIYFYRMEAYPRTNHRPIVLTDKIILIK